MFLLRVVLVYVITALITKRLVCERVDPNDPNSIGMEQLRLLNRLIDVEGNNSRDLRQLVRNTIAEQQKLTFWAMFLNYVIDLLIVSFAFFIIRSLIKTFDYWLLHRCDGYCDVRFYLQGIYIQQFQRKVFSQTKSQFRNDQNLPFLCAMFGCARQCAEREEQA